MVDISPTRRRKPNRPDCYAKFNHLGLVPICLELIKRHNSSHRITHLPKDQVKLCITILLLAIVSSISIHAKGRIWTSDMGTEIHAEFVNYEYGQVTLKTDDGRIIEVPLTRFSTGDQYYIQELNTQQRPTHPGLSQIQANRRGHFSMISGFIIIVAFITAAICYIWQVVLAFSQSALWGFCVLFVPGAHLFFIIRYWSVSKAPFLYYLIAILIAFGAFIFEMEQV